MLFVLKHWRIFAIGFAVLSVIGGLWAFGHAEYTKGKKQAEMACEQEKQASRNALEKKNERIENERQTIARPDTADFIDVLRNGEL